jgi:TPR repeat protein
MPEIKGLNVIRDWQLIKELLLPVEFCHGSSERSRRSIDRARAARYFKLAADQGNATVQFNSALCLHEDKEILLAAELWHFSSMRSWNFN